uniref:F-box protein AT5G49610-like beta-propeller domain-containing protein n=1 Tax=Hordeum vulgare subsp. vulgare TaxID=112509 RepID=A0A287T3X0_HORVV
MRRKDGCIRLPLRVASIKPSILIGSAVYWLIYGGHILVFDIERQTLGVIDRPADVHWTDIWSFQLLRTDNGCGLGLAVMSGLSIHLWERKLNTGGVVGWVLLQKTIPQEIMFPQRMRSDHKQAAVVGYDYDEESNVVVLATFTGDFMLRLESMRFRRISERNVWDNNTIHYPYRNFYTVGSAVGWKWLDLKL